MIQLAVSGGQDLVKEAVCLYILREIGDCSGLYHGVYEVRALEGENVRKVAGRNHGLELDAVIGGHSLKLQRDPGHILLKALYRVVIRKYCVVIGVSDVNPKRYGLVFCVSRLLSCGVRTLGRCGGRLCALLPACSQAKRHCKNKQQRQKFFHSPLLLCFWISYGCMIQLA